MRTASFWKLSSSLAVCYLGCVRPVRVWARRRRNGNVPQREVIAQRTVSSIRPAPVVVVARRWCGGPGFTPVRSMILRRAFRGV